MADQDGSDNTATGFVCPVCGGALWQTDDQGDLHFACRIGDRFSAAELWIQHSAMRNQALKHSQRILAEHAALAHKLAAWTRAQGNLSAEAGLRQEADGDDHLANEIKRTLDGLVSTPPASGE